MGHLLSRRSRPFGPRPEDMHCFRAVLPADHVQLSLLPFEVASFSKLDGNVEGWLHHGALEPLHVST